MAIFLAGKAVCYLILAFLCYGKLHFKCESADFPAFIKHNFQIRFVRVAVTVEQAKCPLRLKNLPARFQIFGQPADVLKTAAKPAAVFLEIFRRCFYTEIARYPQRLIRALACLFAC